MGRKRTKPTSRQPTPPIAPTPPSAPIRPAKQASPALPDPLELLAELVVQLRQLCTRMTDSEDAALLKLLPPLLAQLRGLLSDHARLQAGKLPTYANLDAVFAAFRLADLSDADLANARTNLVAAQTNPLPPPAADPG